MDIRIKSFEEYKAAYERSVNEPEKFWGDLAQEFIWKKPFERVLEWEFDTPSVKWFQGGQLNITENALDRWVSEDPNRVAFFWEPNDPKEDARELTYKELHQEVCKTANGLISVKEKNNAQGIFDMGICPTLGVGGVSIKDKDLIEKMKKVWKVKSLPREVNESQYERLEKGKLNIDGN